MVELERSSFKLVENWLFALLLHIADDLIVNTFPDARYGGHIRRLNRPHVITDVFDVGISDRCTDREKHRFCDAAENVPRRQQG